MSSSCCSAAMVACPLGARLEILFDNNENLLAKPEFFFIERHKAFTQFHDAIRRWKRLIFLVVVLFSLEFFTPSVLFDKLRTAFSPLSVSPFTLSMRDSAQHEY